MSKRAVEAQIERCTIGQSTPTVQEIAHPDPNTRELAFGPNPLRRHPAPGNIRGGVRVELGGCPMRIAGSLEVKLPDQMLDDERLRRQRTPGALAGRLLDVPPVGHQSEESAAEAQLGFDGMVGQIVQREESGLRCLSPLPRERAIRAQRSTTPPSERFVSWISSSGTAQTSTGVA